MTFIKQAKPMYIACVCEFRLGCLYYISCGFTGNFIEVVLFFSVFPDSQAYPTQGALEKSFLYRS